jgi:hypothetical protein
MAVLASSQMTVLVTELVTVLVILAGNTDERNKP